MQISLHFGSALLGELNTRVMYLFTSILTWTRGCLLVKTKYTDKNENGENVLVSLMSKFVYFPFAY